MATKSPNPIDVHVGSRVKLRRQIMGLSQEKLGEALGVTFQQVQKYERGTNRISASRMQAMSDTLQVPIGYFFENAPVDGAAKDGSGDGSGAGRGGSDGTFSMPEGGRHAQAAEAGAPFAGDVLASPEGMRLNRAFVRIRSLDVRRRLADLATALADADDAR